MTSSPTGLAKLVFLLNILMFPVAADAGFSVATFSGSASAQYGYYIAPPGGLFTYQTLLPTDFDPSLNDHGTVVTAIGTNAAYDAVLTVRSSTAYVDTDIDAASVSLYGPYSPPDPTNPPQVLQDGVHLTIQTGYCAINDYFPTGLNMLYDQIYGEAWVFMHGTVAPGESLGVSFDSQTTLQVVHQSWSFGPGPFSIAYDEMTLPMRSALYPYVTGTGKLEIGLTGCVENPVC